MLSGPQVIVVLKIAVSTVTLIFLTSLVALARGQIRLHGRINIVFFILTAAALVGLEVVARVMDPQMFDYLSESTRQALYVHLCFSLPAAALLPCMLYTGLTHRRRIHLTFAVIFSFLWLGTVITGLFFLPHAAPE